MTIRTEEQWRMGLVIGKGIRKKGSGLTRKMAEQHLREALAHAAHQEILNDAPIDFEVVTIDGDKHLTAEMTIRVTKGDTT